LIQVSKSTIITIPNARFTMRIASSDPTCRIPGETD
jgi:hypothetical protein